MSMRYYMVKVIKTGGWKWGIAWAKNHDDNRFLRIDTPYFSRSLIFSSGNAHYLTEQTKRDKQMIENYEHPKRKDGKLDMRYNKNKK